MNKQERKQHIRQKEINRIRSNSNFREQAVKHLKEALTQIHLAGIAVDESIEASCILTSLLDEIEID